MRGAGEGGGGGGPKGWMWVMVLILVLSGLLALRRSIREEKGGESVEVELAVVGHLSPAELWREAGLPVGMGEPVDPEELRAKLEGVDLVESVTVQRAEGEGPVRLLVRERIPLAMLICPAAGVGTMEGEVAMVVDRWCVAVPVERYGEGELGWEELPRVRVLRVPGFAPGVPLTFPALRSAMEVIVAGKALEGIRAVREIRQTNNYSIVVDFEAGPSVQFAFDDIAGQLQKLRWVESYAEGMSRKLKTVNLVLRRNIPVTFVGELEDEKLSRDVQRQGE